MNPMVPPFVVILPPTLMAVALTLVLVAEKAPRGVFPPMFPLSVIVELPDVRVRACNPAVIPLIVPPKDIASLLVPVLIVVVPTKVNIAGTALLIVNPFAVILLSITTEPVPAADEMVMAPGRVVPPTIPVNVIVPAVPAFKVNV